MPPLDAQPDWPAELRNAAPFTIGQRVYLRGRPDRGSLIVRDVYRQGAGGWRVHAGADARGYELHTSAADLAPWPAGLDEPPAAPFGCMPDGSHPNAWDRKRLADLDDPEHAAAIDDWRISMDRWLGRLGCGR